jgi:alpha-galactosidase
MSIKVAFIGAGSVGFTRRLFRDILAVEELRDTHFSFTDISKRNLDMVVRLCRKDVANNDLKDVKLTATLDRRKALQGADYVINCTRIGGLEAFKLDIDIPLKYGVDQCVGDTLCVGGIMYGQRNIPCVLDFCEDMREVASDNVLFLNYANPNAMNTWAANEFADVDTLGLCHGVQGGHKQIAEVLGAKDKSEVDIICAGINHQTWYIQIIYQGRLIECDELLAAFERHPVYRETEKVRIDVLRRFGYYSTESNGHLSEYVPWYRKRPDELKKWIDLRGWIHGETGGYLRVCSERRNWFDTDFPKWLEADDPPIGPEDRSQEHGSWILEALETGRCYRGHFNVPNGGCITNLPEDCIVEAPGYVDGNGVSIPVVGDLPLACAATLSASVNVQRMSVYAALTGDVSLLKQAVMHDPLSAAVCDTEEIWQMVDEMLIAQAKWLPQYADEIPAAKKRLAAARRKKQYKGTRKWKGGARLKTRSVTQMRRESDKEVMETDQSGSKTKQASRPGAKRKKRGGK